MKFELETLAIVGGDVRMVIVARAERPAPRPVRKCSGVHVIDTTGEAVADVIPFERKRAGGVR